MVPILLISELLVVSYMYEYDNRNILRDDSGHLKVADFGVTKLLKVAKTVKEDRPLSYHDVSCE